MPSKKEKQREFNRIKKEMETTYQASKSQATNMLAIVEDILGYISDLFPTSCFIKVGHYVAPLKIDFLRETFSELSFKYGNSSEIKITMIGKVTRKYNGILDNGIKDSSMGKAYSAISEVLQGSLSEFKILEKDDNIISPVAIYFE